MQPLLTDQPTRTEINREEYNAFDRFDDRGRLRHGGGEFTHLRPEPDAGGAAGPPSAGGTPDAMPFDIPYGQSIGLERAKQVMAAAEAEAKRRNWKMNIAVVDTNGELVQFERMEGAQIASGTVSIGKARTAARFRRESRVVLQRL